MLAAMAKICSEMGILENRAIAVSASRIIHIQLAATVLTVEILFIWIPPYPIPAFQVDYIMIGIPFQGIAGEPAASTEEKTDFLHLS